MDNQQSKIIKSTVKKINKEFFIAHYLDFKDGNFDDVNDFLDSDFETISMVKMISEMGLLKELMDEVCFSCSNGNLRIKCFKYDKVDFENEQDYRRVRYNKKHKDDLIKSVLEGRLYLINVDFQVSVFKQIVRDYKQLIKIEKKFEKDYKNFIKEIVGYIRFAIDKPRRFDAYSVNEDLETEVVNKNELLTYSQLAEFLKVCEYINANTKFNVSSKLTLDIEMTMLNC